MSIRRALGRCPAWPQSSRPPDIPGKPLFGRRRADQPVLCHDRLRFIGDPIAAVAADTPANADRAIAAIVVHADPLPALTDAAAALDPDAPVLHPAGNLLQSGGYARGDLAAAFAKAAYRIDDVYQTGRQMHAFMETEGGIVEPDGTGGLLIHAGTHDSFGDVVELAAILALDPARIRVVAGITGGSFGGKDGLTIQPIACLLALRTGRPVRLHYNPRRKHGRRRQTPRRPHARQHGLRRRRPPARPPTRPAAGRRRLCHP